MTPPPTAPVIFSRWVSWVGILILGAGVSTTAAGASSASAPALATASLQFSALSLSDGTLTGGMPVSYDTGILGWTQPAFTSLGPLGIEWHAEGEPQARRPYLGSTESSSFTPGGSSSWVTAGNVASSPRETIFVRQSVSISDNSTRFTMALEPIDGDVMEGKRLYFSAGLAPGYQSEFSGAGTPTLVVSDTSHRHPTLVMQATAGVGTLSWGGPESYRDPLVNGETTPTLYLHSTSEDEFVLTLTVGFVDHDPCSTSAAATFAASQAGSFGGSTAAHTSCLQAPTWDMVADDETSAARLETGLAMTDFPSGEEVVVEVTGLPEGVTLARGSDEGTIAAFDVTVGRSVAAGPYTPTFSRSTRVTTNGVVTVSRQDSVTGSLTITSAPPVPDPPEAADDDGVEAAEAQPAGGNTSRAARKAPGRAITPEPLPESAPILAPTRPEPLVIDALPEPKAPVPAAPVAEQEWHYPDPSHLLAQDSQIPEPFTAQVWLGAGLAASMLIGAIARYRGRRNRHYRRADVDAA